MDEYLVIHEQRDGDMCIVRPVGEVAMDSMRPLRERVRSLPEEGVRFLIFDLREVAFLDSAGMSVLFSAKKRLDEERGACYVVTHEEGLVARSLHTISLGAVMPHLYDLEAAQSDIARRREECAAHGAAEEDAEGVVGIPL